MSHKAAKIGVTSLVLLTAFGVLLYTSLGESMQVLQVRRRGHGPAGRLEGQEPPGAWLRGARLDRPEARHAGLPLRHPAQRQGDDARSTPASFPTRSRTNPKWCSPAG